MDIRSFFEQYRAYLISAGIITVVLVFLLLKLFQGQEVEETPFPIDTSVVEETIEDVEETLPTTVFVEVKGAVNAPGVYELPGDARIKNVLDIAAVSENADLLTVNQSLKLKDEMVIYVPFKGELDSKEIPYLTTGDSTNLEGSEESSKVNINTADVSELTTLNGIGEKKAQAIIEYREEFGLFSKVEDLMNISGIGEKTFENLQADITIN